MRIWILILGIALASVFSDLSSMFPRFGNTIATAEESDPAPSPTPAPEMKNNLR